MRDGCYKNEELGAGNAEMRNGNKTYLQQLEPILFIYLFIYLFNRIHHDYSPKKD